MIALRGHFNRTWVGEPFVARLTTDTSHGPEMRSQEALLLSAGAGVAPEGFRVYVCEHLAESAAGDSALRLPPELEHLSDGDIIRIDPATGTVSVLYRRASHHNAVFLTEQCNCSCLMCPQPGRSRDDSDWVQVCLDAVALMNQETSQLVITGGEPTMNPDGLLRVIAACRDHLPNTAVHVLSNGRMFNYLSLCQEVARLNHPGLVFGVALYSELPHIHDFLVQAKGAYDQTIRGLMNLRRCGQRLELRIVLMKQNVFRLRSFSQFVARNLPFVEHVAFMGYEMMGHGSVNARELWAAPATYQDQLLAAVDELTAQHLAVSIYNHPMCVLDRRLWAYARQSISDWKAEFFTGCNQCKVRNECGGVFASSKSRFADLVCPVA